MLSELIARDVSGLVINPYEESVFIGRYYLESAMDLFAAGMQLEKERPDHEDSEDDDTESLSRTIETARPMTQNEFDEVENALRDLVHEKTDSFLVLKLLAGSALSGSWIVAAGLKYGRADCFRPRRRLQQVCQRKKSPRSRTGSTKESEGLRCTYAIRRGIRCGRMDG